MNRRLLFLLLTLVLSALACSQPFNAPEPTPTRMPPSTQDAEQFKIEMATAAARLAESGELSMTITEQQLTAALIDALAAQPDLQLTQPLVLLQDGQILLSGIVLFGKTEVPVQISLTLAIQDGILSVTVTSANFGILPVPETLLANLTKMINENLNEMIMVEGRNIQVQQIEIADGKMKITGKSR